MWIYYKLLLTPKKAPGGHLNRRRVSVRPRPRPRPRPRYSSAIFCLPRLRPWLKGLEAGDLSRGLSLSLIGVHSAFYRELEIKDILVDW